MSLAIAPTPYERARAKLAALPEAVAGPERNANTFLAMTMLLVCRLPEAEMWEVAKEYNARCVPPWSDRELQHKIDAARAGQIDLPDDGWIPPDYEPMALVQVATPHLYEVLRHEGGEFRRNKEGEWVLTGSQVNVRLLLLHDPACPFRPAWNLFARRLTDRDNQWTDERTTECRIWLHQAHGVRIGAADLDAVISLVAQQRAYHPVKDWLTTLTWDGTHRANTWLTDYLGCTSSPYSAAVGRKWLVSAVARIFEPGCKVDHVLLLKGAQGVGKTTALRVLAGAEWYSDSPLDIGNKDAFQSLPGLWIVELGELASVYRSQQETVKNFLTSTSDTYRPSYGRHAVTVPRGCVFAATTNDDVPLKDPTGARRFWPVTTGVADCMGLAAARAQIWAEALALYRTGEPWWFDRATESELAGPEQDAHTEVDPWEEVIDSWIDPFHHEPLTTHRIMTDCLHVLTANLKQADKNRVANVMKRLGYTQCYKRDASRKTVRVWERTDGCPVVVDKGDQW